MLGTGLATALTARALRRPRCSLQHCASTAPSSSWKPAFLSATCRYQTRSPDPRCFSHRGFASKPEITKVLMPALSPTMTHGTINEWTKKPGESCAAGDVLCEIETDKATVAFEVQDEYVLAKILEEAKAREVKVGEPVALSVEDEKAYKAFLELDKTGQIELPTSPPTTAPPSTDQSSKATGGFSADSDRGRVGSSKSEPEEKAFFSPSGRRVELGDFRFSPAARHLLESKGLQLKDEQGTGKSGRVTKTDVIVAIANGQVIAKERPAQKAREMPAAPTRQTQGTSPEEVKADTRAPAADRSPVAPPSRQQREVDMPQISAAPGSFTDIKNSNMRKIIARRLTESKSGVPHSYGAVECELDLLLAFRKRLKKEYEVNISVNDVIIRSAALALRDVPEANAFWDTKQQTAMLNSKVDVSVAVATPNGLITPIISNSDRKRLTEISSSMRDLAGRARQGKLKPEEFQGGSFTVSNLGMFGVDEFSAVINPPQACIMAVGRGTRRVKVPRFQSGQESAILKPYVATVLTACLSYDRRVVDEAIAAQFLKVFQSYMSKPEMLLL